MGHDVHINVDTSAPVTVQRLEIITGAGGRRRWSAATKAQIVAESFAPGAIVTVVARRHGLAPQQLHGWRKLARAGALVMPAETSAFVPLIAAVAETPAPTARELCIEIELAGVTVRAKASALADLVDIFIAVRRSA